MRGSGGWHHLANAATAAEADDIKAVCPVTLNATLRHTPGQPRHVTAGDLLIGLYFKRAVANWPWQVVWRMSYEGLYPPAGPWGGHTALKSIWGQA